MERNSNYIYGSVAPKIPQEPERYSERKKVSRRAPQKALPSQSSIPKLQMIFLVVFMVLVSFVILYRYTTISEMNYQMGMLTEEYNKIRNENRTLKVDIETSINLDYVKEYAETKLSMHKPDSYQLVLVDVPKSDYSVVVNQDYIDGANQNTSLMSNIINLFKAILP